jgi:LCP family protein required for cell wall assembly
MGLLKHGRHYKKPALWKRILKWTALSILTIILTLGLAVGVFVYRTLGKMTANSEVIAEVKQNLDIPEPDKPENILVMGTDEDPDGASRRSDSMMLVRVSPQGEFLSVLSIPRDLIVNIPGVGPDKINAAYAIGGLDLARQTVKDLTGENIHHVVLMDFTGFSQAVDSLGGVYVDVDKLYFNDNSTAAWGEAYDPIDIDPGYQKLNGPDALAFVRYRHTDSDFMRIKRQQLFLRDAKSQSMKWGNITRIPELVDIFASNTKTSFEDRGDILSLAKFMLDLDKGRIHQDQIPIIESGGSVLLDKEKLPEVISAFESPSFEKPQPPVPGAPPPPPVPSDQTKKLTVEVRNGSDISGAANLVTNLMVGKGMAHTQVGVDELESFADNQIYFQGNNQAAADELATLMRPCQVAPLPADVTTKAQIVIIVGDNFAGELTEKAPEVKQNLQFESDPQTGLSDWEDAASQVPFTVKKPGSLPSTFDYVDFRAYEIGTDDGPRPALKVVAEDEGGNSWGIMETTFTDAPLLEAPSVEREISGRNYRFYYSDDQLRYIAWQDGDVVYWITNSLQGSLSEVTMIQLAVSFKQV